MNHRQVLMSYQARILHSLCVQELRAYGVRVTCEAPVGKRGPASSSFPQLREEQEIRILDAPNQLEQEGAAGELPDMDECLVCCEMVRR